MHIDIDKIIELDKNSINDMTIVIFFYICILFIAFIAFLIYNIFGKNL